MKKIYNQPITTDLKVELPDLMKVSNGSDLDTLQPGAPARSGAMRNTLIKA